MHGNSNMKVRRTQMLEFKVKSTYTNKEKMPLLQIGAKMVHKQAKCNPHSQDTLYLNLKKLTILLSIIFFYYNGNASK